MKREEHKYKFIFIDFKNQKIIISNLYIYRYKHLKKFQTIHYDIYTHDETVQNEDDPDVD